MAAAQAQLALNELLRGTAAHEALPGNTVILANRTLEIIAGQLTLAQGAVWATIERKPDCLVCGTALRDAARREAGEEARDWSLEEFAGADRRAAQGGEKQGVSGMDERADSGHDEMERRRERLSETPGAGDGDAAENLGGRAVRRPITPEEFAKLQDAGQGAH